MRIEIQIWYTQNDQISQIEISNCDLSNLTNDIFFIFSQV